jgi:hypothetical protein
MIHVYRGSLPRWDLLRNIMALQIPMNPLHLQVLSIRLLTPWVWAIRTL